TVCGTCPAKTPVCDTKAKRCVACLADTDCPSGNRCRMQACTPFCTAQTGCGDAGICDVDAGTCAPGCAIDTDCKDQTRAFCDPAAHRCVPCSPSSDRCPTGSYCGMKNGAPACLPGCKTD